MAHRNGHDDNTTGAFFNGMNQPGAFAGLQGGELLIPIAPDADWVVVNADLEVQATFGENEPAARAWAARHGGTASTRQDAALL